jgi:hypothetical protein
MYFHCIFMLKAIFGVDLDLSTLYHGYFMFLGAFEGYSARVASYKKDNAPHCQIITHTRRESLLLVLFYSSLIMEYLCALLED